MFRDLSSEKVRGREGEGEKGRKNFLGASLCLRVSVFQGFRVTRLALRLSGLAFRVLRDGKR